MNVEQARFNMVEQQIRPWEVLDQDVLDLLYVVRREDFVPEAYREFAFSDLEIPLYENAGEGERMMQPKVEARILQELAVKKSERVLEVGTGSGYLAALLAARAHHVHSVEINPKLKAFGEDNLRRAEEHTSELQSRRDLVCRLLLEKKKKNKRNYTTLKKKKTNQYKK